MIKFFRNFRQKLIKQNKMSKYFKYAIGEIILVVIGILIALQINNWNEVRKLKVERKQLITSIKEDLFADVLMINNLLERTIEDQKTLQKQSEYISSKSFSIDSLSTFVKNTNQFYGPFQGFNNNAYNSAKSSGNIEIINTKLKRKLFELSVLQKDVQSTLKEYKDVHVNYIMKLHERFPITFDFSFIKSGEAKDLMWSNVDKKELALKLNSWGTSKGNLYRLMIADLKKALESTKEVLAIIDKENNND